MSQYRNAAVESKIFLPSLCKILKKCEVLIKGNSKNVDCKRNGSRKIIEIVISYSKHLKINFINGKNKRTVK